MRFTRADFLALLTGMLFAAMLLYAAYLDAQAPSPPTPYPTPPYLDSGRL